MTMPRHAPDTALDASLLDEFKQRLVEAKDFHVSRLDAGRDAADDITAAIAERSQVALVEVEAALEAIEAGTYGICASCDRGISEERLDAIPHARLCASCASRRP